MSFRHVPVDTAVVRVTGEDAEAFLQGQCTADLRGVALTDALWLNRKGRVLAHTVVVREADGSFLLLCPHLRPAELIAVVTANVIADDVVTTDESTRWDRWMIWGESTPVVPGARLFATRRYGVLAWDVLAPPGTRLPGPAGALREIVNRRVLMGIPAVPDDCGPGNSPGVRPRRLGEPHQGLLPRAGGHGAHPIDGLVASHSALCGRPGYPWARTLDARRKNRRGRTFGRRLRRPGARVGRPS